MAIKEEITVRVSSIDVVTYPANADFTTDAIDFSKYSKAWIVYLESTHTVGSPQITIEVSNDGSSWLNYVDDATSIFIPCSIGESKFYPKFMRISYVANSSNGNVTFKYNKIYE